MLILGIDPGLTRCGLAVIDAGPRPPAATLVAIGVATSASGDPIPQRVTAIADEIRDWVAVHKPEIVAIEQVFVQRNLSNALGTAQVMGAASVEATRVGAEVVTYTPTQVKAAVTGHGGAAKDQIAQMVVRSLKLAEVPKPADAADAAAVALCHAWQNPMQTMSRAAVGQGRSPRGGMTEAQQRWQQASATTRVRSWDEKLVRRRQQQGE